MLASGGSALLGATSGRTRYSKSSLSGDDLLAGLADEKADEPLCVLLVLARLEQRRTGDVDDRADIAG